MVDGTMDATMLVTWCRDKDKGDGCYNDKDNVKIEEAARLRRQRQVDVILDALGFIFRNCENLCHEIDFYLGNPFRLGLQILHHLGCDLAQKQHGRLNL